MKKLIVVFMVISGVTFAGYLPGGGAGVKAEFETKETKFLVSVKDFGAVGDGSTDDTSAIQSALSSVATNQMPLYLPHGIYKITTNLYYQSAISGVLIFGDGEGRSIIQSVATNYSGIKVLKSGTSWAEALTIKNLSIIGAGNTSVSSGVSGSGIEIENHSSNLARLHLEGVKVSRWNNGLLCGGADQLQIENSQFDYNEIGLNFYGVLNAALVQSSSLNNNFGTNVVSSAGRGLNIIGCDIGGTYAKILISLNGCMAASIIGCNFEVSKNTIYAIKNTAVDSQMTIASCYFLGIGTPTNDIIFVGRNNAIISGCFSSSISTNSSLVYRDHQYSNISGTQSEARDDGSVRLSGSDGFTWLNPFSQISSEYLGDIAPTDRTRFRVVNVIGTTANAEDNILVDWREMNAGVPTMHQSSIINDYVWFTTNRTWTVDQNYSNGVNLVFGTNTGTRIGTNSLQKLSLWGVNPVVQPANVANATNEAHAITQLNDLLAKLRAVGVISTNTP